MSDQATDFGDEHTSRETARQIESQRPGWMVVWGVYTKEYVAFPLFHAARGAVVAVYPEALVARMEAAERTAEGVISGERSPQPMTTKKPSGGDRNY